MCTIGFHPSSTYQFKKIILSKLLSGYLSALILSEHLDCKLLGQALGNEKLRYNQIYNQMPLAMIKVISFALDTCSKPK